MLKLKSAALALALAAAVGAHAADPIKVGVALDISGPFATIGAETRDGLNLAIEQLGGKLGGFDAEFLQTDFAGNPEPWNSYMELFVDGPATHGEYCEMVGMSNMFKLSLERLDEES